MCTDKINFFKHSVVSHARETPQKNNPVFYEQKTVIISRSIKIKLFYKFYSADPSRRLKNAEVTGIITNNGKICFRIKDTYDKDENIKFKQIEIFPFLPDGNTQSHIKYKCAPGMDNSLVLNEVEFKDAEGKMWIEQFNLSAAPPNTREYAEFPQAKQDETKLYAPYHRDGAPSVEKHFNCTKTELARWLLDNFTVAQNRNYFDISADKLQNCTKEDIENLFLLP